MTSRERLLYAALIECQAWKMKWYAACFLPTILTMNQYREQARAEIAAEFCKPPGKPLKRRKKTK